MATTPTRTYKVERKDSIGATRLVKATTAAQALRHVASDTLQVAVATQDDLIELLPLGVKVESAAEAAEPAA